uniref:Transposable element P transposase-like RNase H domain-containing protein n=1 Tax=Anopheles epiroticus TaxID=199890 RepID=A0A182PX92_9DIPT
DEKCIEKYSFVQSNRLDYLILDGVKWTKREISSAFTLRYFGKRGYDYMAKDMRYPLPSISTLQKYARRINLKQELSKDILVFMVNYAKCLALKDRECILSFDAMEVEKIREYDQALDEVLGPHNYMQVVMARGLFKHLKQPVYIGFDQKMTKQILLDIIKELYLKNINVAAVVSDNCSTNKKENMEKTPLFKISKEHLIVTSQER